MCHGTNTTFIGTIYRRRWSVNDETAWELVWNGWESPARPEFYLDCNPLPHFDIEHVMWLVISPLKLNAYHYSDPCVRIHFSTFNIFVACAAVVHTSPIKKETGSSLIRAMFAVLLMFVLAGCWFFALWECFLMLTFVLLPPVFLVICRRAFDYVNILITLAYQLQIHLSSKVKRRCIAPNCIPRPFSINFFSSLLGFNGLWVLSL